MVPPAGDAIALVRAMVQAVPCAAADIGCPGAQDRAVRPLGPAGAEFQHRAAPGLPGRSGWPWWQSGSGGSGPAAGTSRRTGPRWPGRGPSGSAHRGKTGRALGHGVDIPGEAEGPQIVQKRLVKACRLAPEIGNDPPRSKCRLLDILDHLLQARRDGKAAFVRARGGKTRQNRRSGLGHVPL